MLRDGVVDVRLVYDFRYELRHVVDQGGIRSGDLGAVDCTSRTIFDEQAEKGEDASYEKGHDEKVDDEEDGETATHNEDGGVAKRRSR